MTFHLAILRRTGATLIAVAFTAALLLVFANTASAAIVATVPLSSAANYSVLGGQSVTNTGPSVLHGSLGVSPGSSITGFGVAPNGTVVPPAVTDNNNAASAQAQLDLNAAYTNAMNRVVTANQPADLTGLTLQGGVYAVSSNGAMAVSGALTLDGAGDPSTVFIFETDSTLTIGAGSVINLIGNAQECNVFWRVGSSATLHAGADFTGNILAQTSVVLDAGVTVHGRALAQTGSVTLINDTFDLPTCALAAPATTTTAPAPGATAPVVVTSSTAPGAAPAMTTTLGLTVGIVGPPRTGVAPLSHHTFPWAGVLLAGTGGLATVGVIARRRMQPHRVPRTGR